MERFCGGRSPDSSQIAFRSERDGGGIYVVGVLGGQARVVAREGSRPRFSPDGRYLAYSVENRNFLPHVSNSGMVYLIATGGGTPQQVQPQFTSARSPIWTPDGKHVLFVGISKDKNERYDWWVSPVLDGPAIRTGVVAALLHSGLASPGGVLPFFPAYWVGNTVVFSARAGDSINLWQVPISTRTWQVAGVPRRLTFGAGPEL
jgi:dipeptidyl aminopeptidase/acylaminoacyl peptidase